MMDNLTLILNNATLQSLANHANKDELNATFAAHRDRIKDELTKTEREIFFMLACYSVKYYGVSWLSHKTIAADLGCSTKTVQRAFNKFVSLGAVEVFVAKRPQDRRQTANIVRFVKVAETTECPVNVEEIETNVHPTNTSLNTKNLKHIKTFEEKPTAEAQPAVDSATKDSGANTVTKQDLAVAHSIPVDVVYATNSVQLSDRKFVELFSNDGAVLRDALFKYAEDDALTPLLVRWDLTNPVYLRCLKSAAVRTAYRAKHFTVRSTTAYFITTYCDLVTKEMQAIEAIAV
ncbi:helix-turn-helix domain-containing protein [Rhodococcus sp. IEGM1300]